MTNIAELGIAVDSGDAVQAATDLDKLTQAGVKAEKATEDLASGFNKAGAAASELATAEKQLAESTEDAKTRLVNMARASLEASDYHKSLTTSVSTTGVAMDGAKKATTDWAAVQEAANQRGKSLLDTEIRLAEETKKAAAATGVQADGLQALLSKINPAVAALAKLDDQQEQLGKFKKAGLIDPDTFKDYSARIDAARQKITAFGEDVQKAGGSTRQTQAALRQLPAQFTDIFTSLAGGQNPLTVLLQQGGQIKDSFGGLENTFDALKGKIKSLFGAGTGAADLGASLAGVASGAQQVTEKAGAAGESLSGLAEGTNTAAEAAENAQKAVGSLGPAVSGATTSFLSIVGAILAAAAAVGVLVYGYSQGSKEADEYNKALILTGNVAGTTASQLAGMASQVAATNGTVGDAAKSLVLIASSGSIAGESFKAVADAAAAMEDATGRAVEETIAEFVKIGKDPVAAAKDLNAQYGFLTAATYAQIQALNEQGDRIGAAKVLTDAYADTISSRTTQITDNLGTIEKAWKGIKDSAAAALDSIKEVGRQATLDDQIKDVDRRISQVKTGGFGLFSDSAKMLEALTDQRNMLEDQKAAEADIAKYEGERAVIQKEGIAAQQRLKVINDSNLTNAEKRDKLTKDYLRDVEVLKKANPADPFVQPDYVAKRLQSIKDKNKDPATPKGRAGSVDLSAFNDAKNALSGILADYQSTQKQLDAAQKAGLISQADYALKREALISNEREEVTAAYEAEISSLEAAKAKQTTSANQRIELDQKIADARANMVKAQKDADSQLEVLAASEKGRLAKQEQSIKSYIQALGEQQKALELAGQRAVLGVGRGDKENALNAQLNSQQDRFAQQALDLANQKSDPSRNMSEEEFTRKSQALADANKKATDQIRQNYADVETAQGDWTSGATSAWANYLDSAKDIAGQTKSLFSNAFSSMEDAIVSFATTGKLSFSDFAKSIISDMARIAARQAATGLLSTGISALSGAFSSGATTAGSSISDYTGAAFQAYATGARATGGSVAPSSLYQVNEKGAELYNEGGKSYLMTGANGGSVTPLTSGSAAAMSSGSGSSGVQVSIAIASDGSTDVSSNQTGLQQFGTEVGKLVEQKYKELEARSLGAQGNIRKAINGRA